MADDRFVFGGGFRPQLPHIPQQSDLATAHPGQIVQGDGHGGRIGIVGILNQEIPFRPHQLGPVVGGRIRRDGREGLH